MSAASIHKPFVVARRFDPAAAIGHYETLALQRGNDVDYCRQRIAAARAEGHTDDILSQWPTRAEAGQEAARLNADYPPPGVSYYAERCDIGELNL